MLGVPHFSSKTVGSASVAISQRLRLPQCQPIDAYNFSVAFCSPAKNLTFGPNIQAECNHDLIILIASRELGVPPLGLIDSAATLPRRGRVP